MREQSEEDLADRMDEISALRDEIRIKLHLASMDLQDEWKKLESTLPPEDRTLASFRSARAALDELIDKLRSFGGRLPDEADH